MNTVVYDIEIFPNFFSYTDIDIATNEVTTFVIHESRNELDEFFIYNSQVRYRIGYNNINFDRIVCDFIIENYERWKKMPIRSALQSLYNLVQNVIKTETKEYYRGTTEIDLFLMNHFNNKSKWTSLKALQVGIFWENVQDMPIHYSTIVTEDMIDQIMQYNLNDVLSTAKFFDLNRDKLTFRKELGKIYRKFMLNMPDISIGEEIFTHEIRKQSGIKKGEMKDGVVYNKTVELSKCILPYVKFNSAAMNQLLEKIKWTVVSDAQKLKYSVNYKNFRFDYGVGGIHGCVPPGIHRSDDHYVIIDFDVKSYYPNLAIQNGLHPQHIAQEVFIKTYNSIFEKRVQAQSTKNSIEDAGYKLALNGIFGKTGEVTSAFYDRYYFYSITLNGQLLLSMLAEWYLDRIDNIQILQINTDGVTVRIPRSQVKTIMEINEEFMSLTKLILEYVNYDLIVIRDVNNYLAVTDKGKVKKKGIFESDKEFHKDNSFLIVPMALEQYYVNNIPVKETIESCENIYFFCGRYKAYRGWSAVFNYSQDGEVVQENHGKILRFYPCTHGGGTSWKVNDDGRIHNLLANQMTINFNRYFALDNFADYNLNYEFFVRECNKIIDEIEPKQLKLF
jgi:hypothetical protein